MKSIKLFTGIGAIILLSAFTVIHSVSWNIAEGYSIKFSSADPTGVFTKFTGDITFTPEHPEAARFNVSIDVNSINTGSGMQNNHAKSEKWFDAEKYPAINFTSSKCAKTETGYELTGTLDMHGVKKEITFPFTFANNIFSSSFTVNRLDFGIGKEGGKVPNDMKMDISVPVIQK